MLENIDYKLIESDHKISFCINLISITIIAILCSPTIHKTQGFILDLC